MKKILYLLVISTLLISCGTSKNTTSTKTNKDTIIADTKPYYDVTFYGKTITSDELKEALYTYASDEFEGRETGEPGQKKAIEYLKKHYVGLEIPSPISEGDYYQEVPLQRAAAPEVDLQINGKSFKIKDDFVSLSSGKDGQIIANEVIYAGYGIEEENYSSYKDLDVKGKIVMIKAGEPKNADGTFTISDSVASKWSTRQQYGSKMEIAKKKGAAALFFYDPAVYAMVAQNFGGSSGRISLRESGDEMHWFFVNATLAKELVSDIDTEARSEAISASMKMDYKNVSEEFNSENVLAMIRGTEKPDEVIVISAHLDHDGIKDGKIYNGADDDGSGSVALLEIAEAFKKAAVNGHGPKRSVLFLHVTGEEKGLLGSRYYTDVEPVIPLENTVANLNIDMIGRSDPKRKSTNRNYVYLIGSDKLSTELHNLSEEINKKYCNIELDYTFNDENDPNRFYYRSDHYNFAKNNIPIIFYFNGTHEDYHKHTDTADKIEYDLLENRTRLVFYTAWELANRSDRISVDKALD